MEKFMKQKKKPKSSVGWQHTGVDKNKTKPRPVASAVNEMKQWRKIGFHARILSQQQSVTYLSCPSLAHLTRSSFHCLHDSTQSNKSERGPLIESIYHPDSLREQKTAKQYF